MTRWLPGRGDLRDRVAHVGRREELSLLDVDDACRCAPPRRCRSVWRDRNAGICRTSATSATGAACAGSWMSVRIGTPARVAHARQDAQALVEARAAKRVRRRAVRLVVRRLEDVRHAGARARCRACACAGSTACASLSMTHGPGDEQQRCAAAHRQPGERRSWFTRLNLPRTSRRLPLAARACAGGSPRRIPANSGCGLSGFDLNSGWNCTATYHGCVGSSMISTNLPSSERPTISRPSRSAPSRRGS